MLKSYKQHYDEFIALGHDEDAARALAAQAVQLALDEYNGQLGGKTAWRELKKKEPQPDLREERVRLGELYERSVESARPIWQRGEENLRKLEGGDIEALGAV